MPDDLPNDEDQPTEGDIRDYRAAKDEASNARREAEQARRELAFLKAGIDTEAGAGKWFAKGYDGELTVDAIKAAAEADGIFGAPEPKLEPQVAIPPDERAQYRERSALAAQSEPPEGGTGPTPDPTDEGLRLFQKGRAEGMRLEDAAASYFHTVIGAAMTGDKRAQFNPEEYAARAGDS